MSKHDKSDIRAKVPRVIHQQLKELDQSITQVLNELVAAYLSYKALPAGQLGVAIPMGHPEPDEFPAALPAIEPAHTDDPAPVELPARGGGGAPGDQVHIVQAGETLGIIALRYYGNANDFLRIANYNSITGPKYLIYVGQPLVIPNGGGPAVPQPPPAPATRGIPGAGEMVHIVQAGETLIAIGKRYRIDYVYIAQRNGITAPQYIIRIGQPLVIPR